MKNPKPKTQNLKPLPSTPNPQNPKPLKLLLTGATGFLGGHLLRAFVEAGNEVVILKRSFSDTRRIKGCLDKVKSFDIDLVPIERPFEECGRFDCVVHTATNYGRQGETATEVFDANLAFPLKLLNTATFFNTATILYAYLNYYALSKRQFEDWGRVFANQGKIQFINIKLEHMYGQGDDPSKFTTWVVQSCLKHIEKLDLTLGEQKRDFIYIDDVVEAYNLLLKKGRQSGAGFQEFDLGSGKAVSIREFVETVRRLTCAGTELAFGAKPYREHELMHSEADITKLLDLGWKPKYDLITGLGKMIKREEKVLGSKF
jgi:CDP-paratose synthetase